MLKLNLQFHAAPGHTTPLREDTFKNLQLNAGILIKNFDYSGATNAGTLKNAINDVILQTGSTAGALLGATRGGGSFTITREIRTPEADGKRYGYKGDSFVDSCDAYLSTTLIEITPENLIDALASATSTKVGKVTTIKLATAIDADDYLTNVCWVGDISDGRYVLIALDNALNQADLTLTWTDKGEGTLPVEFHAKQSNLDDYDYAPFEVKYYEVAT